ncbi:MAG: hypothetical protein O3A25_18275 [Acidobacteria bacterium]|nr:hypothetical protein [Acidobacteriota bacterium]
MSTRKADLEQTVPKGSIGAQKTGLATVFGRAWEKVTEGVLLGSAHWLLRTKRLLGVLGQFRSRSRPGVSSLLKVDPGSRSAAIISAHDMQ